MIPLLAIMAIMFAVYASARLANDVGRQHPGDVAARNMAWFTMFAAGAVIWLLAALVVATGAGYSLSSLK